MLRANVRAVALLSLLAFSAAYPCFDIEWETDQNGAAIHSGDNLNQKWNNYFTVAVKIYNNANRLANQMTTTLLRAYDSSTRSVLQASNDPDLGTPNRVCTNCPSPSSWSGLFGSISCPGGSSSDTAPFPANHPKNNNCVKRNIVAVMNNASSTTNAPNDGSFGGVATFTFKNPVIVARLGVLDVDANEPGGDIHTWDQANVQFVKTLQALGDNTWSINNINQGDVVKMEVKFRGSGAITDFEFCVDEPECQRPFCTPCDADTRISSLHCLDNGNVVHHSTAGKKFGAAFADVPSTDFGSGCISTA